MDLMRGAGWVEASPSSTRVQQEHGVGMKENQTILKKEKCVEMLQYGKYNNIKCQAQNYDNNPGYICEKQVSKFMIMPKLWPN